MLVKNVVSNFLVVYAIKDLKTPSAFQLNLECCLLERMRWDRIKVNSFRSPESNEQIIIGQCQTIIN